MKLLTNERQKLYKNPKICYICKEKVEDVYSKDKKYHKATQPASTGSQDVLKTSPSNVPRMSHERPMEDPS